MLNRRRHELFDAGVAPRPLSVAQLLAGRGAGAVVLDARDPQQFAAGHVRGALNVPADGRFAETAGMVVDPGQEIVVVAPQDREEEVVTRLARIGFDQVAGHLREPEAALLQMVGELDRGSRVTVAQLRAALAAEAPPLVLDVRNGAEREGGVIDGALHIPLAQLPSRLAEVPTDRPVVVHCAAGYRSSVAASLLRKAGHPDVSDLLGGYQAWQAAHQPVTA